MRTVILIRHGKTRENLEHRYCGRGTDSQLCPEGIEELRRYRAEGFYYFPKFNRDNSLGRAAAFTSGMRRAEETLEIIAGNPAEHKICPDLSEINFGSFEGKTYESLRDRQDYQTWIQGANEANICPGGESGEQMTDRVLRAYRKILEGDFSEGKVYETVLIVTHGGPIAAIMTAEFPEAGRNRYEWQPSCGRGYIIKYDGSVPVSFETAGPQ